MRKSESGAMAPEELRSLEGGRVLSILWDDGEVSRLDATLLLRNSRSASTRRAEAEGDTSPVSDDIRLADIRLVGVYGVQLVFSDGHDRGIYPWIYLRELADAVK